MKNQGWTLLCLVGMLFVSLVKWLEARNGQKFYDLRLNSHSITVQVWTKTRLKTVTAFLHHVPHRILSIPQRFRAIAYGSLIVYRNERSGHYALADEQFHLLKFQQAHRTVSDPVGTDMIKIERITFNWDMNALPICSFHDTERNRTPNQKGTLQTIWTVAMLNFWCLECPDNHQQPIGHFPLNRKLKKNFILKFRSSINGTQVLTHSRYDEFYCFRVCSFLYATFGLQLVQQNPWRNDLMYRLNDWKSGNFLDGCIVEWMLKIRWMVHQLIQRQNVANHLPNLSVGFDIGGWWTRKWTERTIFYSVSSA